MGNKFFYKFLTYRALKHSKFMQKWKKLHLHPKPPKPEAGIEQGNFALRMCAAVPLPQGGIHSH